MKPFANSVPPAGRERRAGGGGEDGEAGEQEDQGAGQAAGGTVINPFCSTLNWSSGAGTKAVTEEDLDVEGAAWKRERQQQAGEEGDHGGAGRAVRAGGGGPQQLQQPAGGDRGPVRQQPALRLQHLEPRTAQHCRRGAV